MDEKVSINIHSVATVGMNTLKDTVDHYATGVGAPLTKAGSLLAGLVGTNEAQTFAAWHSSLIEAAGAFVKDATLGLESHGSALIVVAANSRNGDQSQAKQVDDVVAAFAPTPDQDSVAKANAAAAKAAKERAARDEAVKEKVEARASWKKNHLAAPDDLDEGQENATVSPMCTQPSALEQYEEHMKRYGDDERWTPPDPDDQPVLDPPVALGPGTL